MEKTREIDLMQIVMALVNKIWIIVLCGVFLGIAALAYTDCCITPLYRATISVYVNNTISGYAANGISASDLETSQKLVTTYVNILKSDSVLEKVAEKVEKENGIKLSASKIRGMLSAGAMGGTEVFQVHISNSDPEVAAAIVNTIALIAPSEISNIVDRSSTKIIDYAKVPGAPYTPSYVRNIAIGVILGGAIAAVIIVLQVLMDVRIHDEIDLAQISNAPVLGVIPSFDLGKIDYGYGNDEEHSAAQREGD